MNIASISLLLLFVTTVSNTSLAGQGGDEKQTDPECDYIAGVEAI